MGKSLQHVKYLTLAVPTCKNVKVMLKVWLSVLIYQTLKAFMEAMKYTLFEVTITRSKFLHCFLCLKVLFLVTRPPHCSFAKYGPHHKVIKAKKYMNVFVEVTGIEGRGMS